MIKKAQYESIAECIRSDQVSAPEIVELFEDGKFLKWYRKKYNLNSDREETSQKEWLKGYNKWKEKSKKEIDYHRYWQKRAEEAEDKLKSRDYTKQHDYKFLVDENKKLHKEVDELKQDNKRLAYHIEDRINRTRKAGM